MTLKILYIDNTMFTLAVRRVTNLIGMATGEMLYYECVNDAPGKGTCINMENIRCWEVTTDNGK